MKDSVTRCDKSYSERHQPTYYNGAIVFDDAKGLASTCQHCGAPIHRAHRKSAWWRAAAETGGKVIDLMEALKASLAREKASKDQQTETGETAGITNQRPTALPRRKALLDEDLPMLMHTHDLRRSRAMGPGGVEPPTSRLSGAVHENGSCIYMNTFALPPATREASTNTRLRRSRHPLNRHFPSSWKATGHTVAFFVGTANTLQTVKTVSGCGRAHA